MTTTTALERVEMYYPMHGFGGPEDIDIWNTKRWRNGNYARLEMVAEGGKPGLSGHPQADSLGDRGEFDRDNSGGGQLYVGVFDRKIHLAGAEFAVPVTLFEFARLRRRLEDLLGRPVDLVAREALKPQLREQILREAVRAA